MTAPAFIRLWDAPPFTVDFLDGLGGDLVIAFASVGHDSQRPPSPEFVGTATGRGGPQPQRPALFVSDESRSWANNPGFGPALLGAMAKLREKAAIGRIATIGLSMGGFAALAATQILPVDVVLAFGPQYSVLPGLGPVDDRWRHWTSRLAAPPLAQNLAFPTAPLPQTGRTWACLFHGLVDDREQAMAFPIRAGTDQLLFDGQTHSGLVPHLKARGGLSGMMEAALANDRRRLLRIAAAAGGQRR